MIDGSVPIAEDGLYSTIAGVTNVQMLKDAAEGAAAVINVGTSAAFGGLPMANPNPTVAVPVSEIIRDRLIVNVSGCPPIPAVIAGKLAKFMTFGALTELDPLGRPKTFFPTTIRQVQCYRLLILSNDFFWDRISTVFEPKSDSQATRVQILGPQFQMFLDHPLGAGYRGNELLSPQYMPVDLLSNSGRRSAHNTFMAALVDQGIVGAVLLLCLYGWGALTFRRLKLMDKQGLPDSLGILRAAIGAGLASLFASGLFLNLLKTEVQIWYVMLAASLVALCEQAVAAETVKKQITVQPADKPLTHNA